MRTGVAPVFLLSLAACAGGRAHRPASPVASGPLQARTAFLTQEVDGEDEALLHRKQVRALGREMGALLLCEAKDRLHFRVPEDRLEDLMAQLADLAPITASSVRAPEVSGAVRDLQVRAESSRALRDRLVKLLDKATTVEEILAVERELGRVTEVLALYEAQLGARESEVAFAEVHLTVEDPASPGPVGWVFYGLYRGVKWLFVWD